MALKLSPCLLSHVRVCKACILLLLCDNCLAQPDHPHIMPQHQAQQSSIAACRHPDVQELQLLHIATTSAVLQQQQQHRHSSHSAGSEWTAHLEAATAAAVLLLQQLQHTATCDQTAPAGSFIKGAADRQIAPSNELARATVLAISGLRKVLQAGAADSSPAAAGTDS